jgi:ABC-type taurine transport system substrate-binding protein
MQVSRLIRSAAAYVFVCCTLLIGNFAASAGDKPARMSVVYFQQWLAPVPFAQAQKTFAAVLGMKVNRVPLRSGSDKSADDALHDFHFPLATEQKTHVWMGGSVVAYNPDMAHFFVARVQLEKLLDSYGRIATTGFLS